MVAPERKVDDRSSPLQARKARLQSGDRAHRVGERESERCGILDLSALNHPERRFSKDQEGS